ncbi:hypothetical protein CGRA01v4_10268 [Colletotrichum graminicola]|nr:hypothetical protein CGRA01v4_10268 [Colletotrichum graminicola]
MESRCGCIKGTGAVLCLVFRRLPPSALPPTPWREPTESTKGVSMRAKDEGMPRSNTKRSCQGLFGFLTWHVVIALLRHCSDSHLRRGCEAQLPMATSDMLLYTRSLRSVFLPHVDRVSWVGLQAEVRLRYPRSQHV